MVEAIILTTTSSYDGNIRKRFAGSYGCMTTVMSFLDGLEKLKW